jgi:hypothetical protein
MTLGQVFGAFGELRPVDRFNLGCLLQTGDRFMPVTTADFAALPIPTTQETGVAFIVGLGGALANVGANVAGWSLGVLVPGIVGSVEAVETAPSASNRLVAMVRSRGFRVWADLDRFTPAEILLWHGAGNRLVIRLIVAAVECALRNAVTEHDHQLRLTFDPPPARSIVCAALDASLTGIPDIRGRAAFEFDDLRLDNTGIDVVTHELLGVTAEYTRRLKNTARAHVTTLAATNIDIAAMVHQLRGLLGQAVLTEGIEAGLQTVGLPGLADPAGALAVWLAGPYCPVPGFPGWWSPQPHELLAVTRRLLADGGGVQTTAALLADLAGLGICDGQSSGWISAQKVRHSDDVVVSLTGKPAAVVARVFEATGRAMSAREVTGWLPAGTGIAEVVTLLRRNAVFVETGPDEWELTDWGGHPVGGPVCVEVPVTAAVLAGAEGDVPAVLAASLGLVPGVERKLSTRFGPFVVSYDGVIVVRGSVRPVVLAAGACLGDVLVFDVDPEQPSVSVTVRADPTSRLFDPVQPGPTPRSSL